MNLGEEELAKIGDYVRQHLPQWLPESPQERQPIPFRSDRELDLFERMIRVEEELKNLGIRMDERFEAMEKRFDAMDKRFDAVDKRFEAVDKRFEAVDKRFEAVDKRFEAVDKRFDLVLKVMDDRFGAVDKRFDLVIKLMDERFNAVDKRFSSLQWFMGTGFFLLAALLSVFHLF